MENSVFRPRNQHKEEACKVHTEYTTKQSISESCVQNAAINSIQPHITPTNGKFEKKKSNLFSRVSHIAPHAFPYGKLSFTKKTARPATVSLKVH